MRALSPPLGISKAAYDIVNTPGHPAPRHRAEMQSRLHARPGHRETHTVQVGDDQQQRKKP